MANAGPFVHAWILPAEIDLAVWRAVHAEVVAVLRASSAELEKHRPGDDLAQLRGPNGFGPLVIQRIQQMDQLMLFEEAGAPQP